MSKLETLADHIREVNPHRYPKHDDPAKGQVYGGVCNRTACDHRGARFWNMGTYALYCRSCANAINDAGRGRPPLCLDLGSKPPVSEHEGVKRSNGYYDPDPAA
jgi:hypothetical protein